MHKTDSYFSKSVNSLLILSTKTLYIDYQCYAAAYTWTATDVLQALRRKLWC